MVAIAGSTRCVSQGGLIGAAGAAREQAFKKKMIEPFAPEKRFDVDFRVDTRSYQKCSTATPHTQSPAIIKAG
jgi:hypothetical protein